MPPGWKFSDEWEDNINVLPGWKSMDDCNKL